MFEYLNMLFDWDDIKAKTNEQKHGVTFTEAMTAFGDEQAQIYNDEEHFEDEDRFILLGYSEKPRLLVVCHCYRESEAVTRIISARKATPHERTRYEKGSQA
jgi:uncharacterized DUF497 family protein